MNIFKVNILWWPQGRGSDKTDHQYTNMQNNNNTMHRERQGHAVVQWLRHCTTNQKVAGSIPDGVIGIFRHNSSGRLMALGSTQPLTEKSIRNISWG
jgi:hypothetical protein